MASPEERLAQTISDFDRSVSEHFESDVFGALTEIMKESFEETQSCPPAVLHERLAFHFRESHDHTPGAPLLQSMVSWRNADGSLTEIPKASDVTSKDVHYWHRRLETAVHPCFRWRYGNLVWQFRNLAADRTAGQNGARNAIGTAHTMATHRDLRIHEAEVIERLEFALSLARTVNEPDLVKSVAGAVIAFEDAVAVDGMLGLWGFSFDLFIVRGVTQLEPIQVAHLISAMEQRFARLCSPENDVIDCHAIENALSYLLTARRKNLTSTPANDWLEPAADAVLRASERILAFNSSIHLNALIRMAQQERVPEVRDKLARRLQDIGPDISSSLVSIEHKQEIPAEDVERFLNEMQAGSLQDGFRRVATFFLPNVKQLEEELRSRADSIPEVLFGGKNILNEWGRTVAVVGPIKTDLEGNLYGEILTRMQLSSGFLHAALTNIFVAHAATPKEVTDLFAQCPLVIRTNAPLVRAAVTAYMGRDFLVAIHLMVPLFEGMMRRLLDFCLGNTLKQSRNELPKQKNLDDLLAEPTIEAILGRDTKLLFRAVLCDPRGWNIRNDVAHGDWSADQFSWMPADRLFQCLLILMGVRAVRKTMPTGDPS